MSQPEDSSERSAIAIIGMAGRFPGASDLDALWRIIERGEDTVSRFTPEECDAGDPDLDSVQRADNYVRARGVLERIGDFDAGFFDYTPADAAATDPQHRIWLEVAWEALEAAGYARDDHGQVVSVFAGSFINTYLLHNLLGDRAALEEYVRMRRARSFATLLRNDAAFLPTRTAYKLDLRGPAINVQTACSTSLVAVAQAVQSLRSYESDISLAGGVCIPVPQQTGYFHQEGAIFSRDGVCRPYDQAASGTVFGSGAGAVVLKRLDDALRDRDPIRALILGSALNNDGHAKVGFAAPSVQGQAEVILAAQTLAGVPAESIGYVEGHGTATPMGDPIEVEALTRAFRTSTDRRQFCALGSLKGNVGHLDAAAGVAGLIRAVLALEHQTLPATAHFRAPNPELRLPETPFFVCSESRAWPKQSAPRRAAVSSFGIGGTNAHVILEEAPALEAVPAEAADGPVTLILSAKSQRALEANTERLAAWLEAQLTEGQASARIEDVAFVLQRRRKRFEHRRAVRVQSVADAAFALRDSSRFVDGVAIGGKPKLFFAFPGQGSLRAGALAALVAADDALRRELSATCVHASRLLDFDLLRWLEDPHAKLDDVERDNARGQLAVFCIDVALARFLVARGVTPDAVVGHSLGEWAAAHLAGVLDLEAATRGVYHRGRLMHGTGPGAALIVRLPEGEAQRYAVDDVSLACVNGPELVLLSGSVPAIERAEQRLHEDGVVHRRAPIGVAVHASCMDAVVEPLRGELAQLDFRPPELPILSSVTGDFLSSEIATSAEYWARQVRTPVQFVRAADTLFREPACIVLEVGPGTALTSLLAPQRQSRETQRVLSVLSRDQGADGGNERLQHCLAELWANGADVDAVGALPAPARAPTLPSYAFDRREHWVAPKAYDPSSSGRTSEPPQALPSDRPSGPPSIAVGPSLEGMQLQIVKLITRLSHLPASQLNPETAFADLGLDSIFLAQLAEALQKKLDMPVRFSELVKNDTIAKLAHALQAQREAAQTGAVAAPVQRGFRGLVPLRGGDERLPMLLVHGDGADHNLPAHLPPGQSLHGYIHQGADGERIELRSVEALAARCHAEWMAVAGDGPCILGGHSYGGLVAYHVAHLRRQSGLPVSLLVLFDSHHPDSLRPPRTLSLRSGKHRAELALRALKWRGEITRADLTLALGRRVPPKERTEYVRSIYELAALDYRPPTIDVDTLLFRASETWAYVESESLWRKLVTGRFDVERVQGNHLSIVRTKEGFEPMGRVLFARIEALRNQRSRKVR